MTYSITEPITQMFWMVRRYPIQLIVLFVPCVGLPAFVSDTVLTPLMAGQGGPFSAAAIALNVAVAVITVVLYAIAYGGAIWLTIRAADGASLTAGEAFQAGLRWAVRTTIVIVVTSIAISLLLIPPLVAAGLLVTGFLTPNGPMMWLFVLVWIGVFVCIAYVTATLAVTVPVRLIENTTNLGALHRSRALTKGKRWKIVVTFVLIGLIGFALSIPLVAMIEPSIAGGSSGRLPVIAANSIVSTIITAAVSVLVAVVYLNLRAIEAHAAEAR